MAGRRPPRRAARLQRPGRRHGARDRRPWRPTVRSPRKADRNASPHVPSSNESAPSLSTFRGFCAGRAGSWQSAHCKICQVQEDCRFWATSTSERWAAQYGPVYLFRKGLARAVVLSDPKWCDQVLRARPETFTRDSGIAPVASEMGLDGVFSAEGDAWRPQRRLAMLALAQRHLRGLYPKLQTVTTRLKKRWERLADAGAPLDVVDR